ncbi:MAG: transposase [Paraburkholderia sp.]|jgi:transposase|nr:transposase [Paraburkholderia sp.]
MVRQSIEPGKTGLDGGAPAWRESESAVSLAKLYQDGSLSAVSAGQKVVPASELGDALKQIKELQRLLGKKTMEVEIPHEAVEYGRAKKWIARSPSLPGDDQ